jgi:hypothetical protein
VHAATQKGKSSLSHVSVLDRRADAVLCDIHIVTAVLTRFASTWQPRDTLWSAIHCMARVACPCQRRVLCLATPVTTFIQQNLAFVIPAPGANMSSCASRPRFCGSQDNTNTRESPAGLSCAAVISIIARRPTVRASIGIDIIFSQVFAPSGPDGSDRLSGSTGRYREMDGIN